MAPKWWKGGLAVLTVFLSAGVVLAAVSVPAGCPTGEANRAGRTYTTGGSSTPGYFSFDVESPLDTSVHYYWKFDNETDTHDGAGASASGFGSSGKVKIPTGATKIEWAIAFDGTVNGEPVWTWGTEGTNKL